MNMDRSETPVVLKLLQLPVIGLALALWLVAMHVPPTFRLRMSSNVLVCTGWSFVLSRLRISLRYLMTGHCPFLATLCTVFVLGSVYILSHGLIWL